MAKPIRATPTLHGEDAIRFVKQMFQEEEKPSKERQQTILKAEANFAYFRKILSSA